MKDEARLLPNGRILRYTFVERLMHWLSALSYVYLLLTGLAFWSPWLFWIAVVLGGATISRELHPWAGLLFVAATFWMYRTWADQMRETEVDKEWWRALPHYIRNEDELVPKIGKYNAGQKSLFWGFFWCGIVLLLSGVDPLVSPAGSLEPQVPPLSRGHRSSSGGASDDCAVHDSSVHGPRHRGRRTTLDGSRGCV